MKGAGWRNGGAKGYRGRRVITGICGINDEVRRMIVDRRPAPLLRDAARRAGMRSIDEDAIATLTGGITSPGVVLVHDGA